MKMESGMLIITGLGRCGTSILTKYIKEIGFGLGKQVHWHDEPEAGLELAPAYSLNRDMHEMIAKEGELDINRKSPGDYWKGYSYKEAILKVDKDERQGLVNAIKDPRFFWHSDLIEAWYETRKDLKFIICHRNINDVYESRKRLPVKWGDPKRKSLDEFYIDFADCFTKILELGIEYKILFFPNFLDNHFKVWDVLCKFGLHHDYDEGKKIWNRIIDKKKVHFGI